VTIRTTDLRGSSTSAAWSGDRHGTAGAVDEAVRDAAADQAAEGGVRSHADGRDARRTLRAGSGRWDLRAVQRRLREGDRPAVLMPSRASCARPSACGSIGAREDVRQVQTGAERAAQASAEVERGSRPLEIVDADQDDVASRRGAPWAHVASRDRGCGAASAARPPSHPLNGPPFPSVPATTRSGRPHSSRSRSAVGGWPQITHASTARSGAAESALCRSTLSSSSVGATMWMTVSRAPLRRAGSTASSNPARPSSLSS
jgi:hypothetical protein